MYLGDMENSTNSVCKSLQTFTNGFNYLQGEKRKMEDTEAEDEEDEDSSSLTSSSSSASKSTLRNQIRILKDENDELLEAIACHQEIEEEADSLRELLAGLTEENNILRAQVSDDDAEWLWLSERGLQRWSKKIIALRVRLQSFAVQSPCLLMLSIWILYGQCICI